MQHMKMHMWTWTNNIIKYVIHIENVNSYRIGIAYVSLYYSTIFATTQFYVYAENTRSLNTSNWERVNKTKKLFEFGDNSSSMAKIKEKKINDNKNNSKSGNKTIVLHIHTRSSIYYSWWILVFIVATNV